MIDLNILSKMAVDNSKKRGNVLEPLKHCACEVVEAMEAFTLYREFKTDILKEQLAGELADVIMCALVLAGQEGIDVEDALLECEEKNRARGGK